LRKRGEKKKGGGGGRRGRNRHSRDGDSWSSTLSFTSAFEGGKGRKEKKEGREEKGQRRAATVCRGWPHDDQPSPTSSFLERKGKGERKEKEGKEE